MARTLLFLVLALSSLRPSEQAPGLAPIDRAAALAHLRRSVPPDYPPLAVAAKVEGTVTIAVIVSPAGTVEAAQPIRSIPILDQAAIDAVKQWQFAPFEVGGQPARVVTQVAVPFYPDPNTARLADDVRDRAGRCRSLLDAKRYDESEAECAEAANMAARLPAQDRAEAYHLAGRMFAARGRPAEAVEAFKAEVKLRGSLDGGATAAAHQALAGVHASGSDLGNARRQYDEAEKAARDFLKSVNRTMDYVHADPAIANYLREYATTLLRSILRDHVECLRRANLDADAAKVQLRLDAVTWKG